MEIQKINQLKELSSIPTNSGEQFIDVNLNIRNFSSGEIRYGFNWKQDMGEISFYSLDEAIKEVKKLREEFNV